MPGSVQTLQATDGRKAQVISHVLQHPPQFSAQPLIPGMSNVSVGLDLNLNGHTDVIVTGPDLNHDGIPDVLQQTPAMVFPPRQASGSTGSHTEDVVGRMLRM
uniref:Uncharacterized protein n=1 Tax=Pyrodinium bahamense TaxID=73915 RepID=A0A7S0FY80_9DINO